MSIRVSGWISWCGCVCVCVWWSGNREATLLSSDGRVKFVKCAFGESKTHTDIMATTTRGCVDVCGHVPSFVRRQGSAVGA